MKTFFQDHPAGGLELEQEETDEDPIVDQKERKNCAELLLVFVAAVEAELVVEEDVAGGAKEP